MPKARTMGGGMRSWGWLMRKFSSERSVWAPQYLSAGTWISPKASLSVLVLAMVAVVALNWRRWKRLCDVRGEALVVERGREMRAQHEKEGLVAFACASERRAPASAARSLVALRNMSQQTAGVQLRGWRWRGSSMDARRPAGDDGETAARLLATKWPWSRRRRSSDLTGSGTRRRPRSFPRAHPGAPGHVTGAVPSHRRNPRCSAFFPSSGVARRATVLAPVRNSPSKDGLPTPTPTRPPRRLPCPWSCPSSSPPSGAPEPAPNSQH